MSDNNKFIIPSVYFSQRDNSIDPYKTCFPTSVAMATVSLELLKPNSRISKKELENFDMDEWILKDMKDNAILANAGHFDHEIDVVSLKNMSKSQEQVSPNLVRYKLKNGKSILLLSEGRLVNLSRPQLMGIL